MHGGTNDSMRICSIGLIVTWSRMLLCANQVGRSVPGLDPCANVPSVWPTSELEVENRLKSRHARKLHGPRLCQLQRAAVAETLAAPEGVYTWPTTQSVRHILSDKDRSPWKSTGSW